jgi:flagellar hook protein FlgE
LSALWVISLAGCSPEAGGAQTGEAGTAAWAQGALVSTANTLDVALLGRGYLVLFGSTRGGLNGSFLSRDGALISDEQGRLVNRTGLRVQGFLAGQNGALLRELGDLPVLFSLDNPLDGDPAHSQTTLRIDEQGLIHSSFSGVPEERLLGQLAVALVDRPDALLPRCQHVFATTALSGEALGGTATAGARGAIVGGSLEVLPADPDWCGEP